jgi:hypothetical protein
MSRIKVCLQPLGKDGAGEIELDTPSIANALTVADINVSHGRAIFRSGDHILARLTKHGGNHATFWQVG